MHLKYWSDLLLGSVTPASFGPPWALAVAPPLPEGWGAGAALSDILPDNVRLLA